MESIDSEKNTGDEAVPLELEYEIQEDFEAELDEFVRLSYTGQFDLAHELFDECLAEHDDWYPVAAEYADCLLRQGKFEQLETFCRNAPTRFSDPQEQAVFRMMFLIGRYFPRRTLSSMWTQSDSTWPALPFKPPYTSLRDVDVG